MKRKPLILFDFEAGSDKPLFLIAGPCVIETEKLTLLVAEQLKMISDELRFPVVFKSSFDKANRSSLSSYRGPGIDKGLRILERVEKEFEIPVLTDVHEGTELDEVSSVVSMLQTPAFLCRQTDFILEVCSQGLPVNIKKGQFLSPEEMNLVVSKAKSTGNNQILVCERGTTFGYNNLVSDMRSLAIMRGTGCPVVFDATHSVQMPGAEGAVSGGQREMVPVLARAAVASGVSGLFVETHPDPKNALSDGPNSWPLKKLAGLMALLIKIDKLVKSTAYQEEVLDKLES